VETRELVNKFWGILINPTIGWVKHNPDNIRFRDLFSPFFIITMIVMFVARLVGKTLTYLDVTDFKYIILYSIVHLIIDLLFFLIIVLTLNALLPYFKIVKSKAKVAVLIYVSLLPFYISMILVNLFPSLFFIGLISLYSFFVLYWGIRYFLRPAKQDSTILFTIVSLLIVGVYLILNFALVYPFFDFVF